MISREMMRESLAVQEWLSEGRDEGEAKGKLRQARVALRTVARARFPRIRIDAAVESIADLQVLNSLIAQAATVPNAAALLQAAKLAQKSEGRKS